MIGVPERTGPHRRSNGRGTNIDDDRGADPRQYYRGPPAVAPPYTDAASRSFPSLRPPLTPPTVSTPARPASLQHRQYAIQREGDERGQPAKSQHRHRHRQHRHWRKGLPDSGDGLHQWAKRAAGGPGDRHPAPSPTTVAARLDATTSQP